VFFFDPQTVAVTESLCWHPEWPWRKKAYANPGERICLVHFTQRCMVREWDFAETWLELPVR